MKKLIALLLLLSYTVAFSQDLSIRLNIIEVKERNFLNFGYLKSKRFIQVPYLEITYHNLSKKDVYFKRMDGCKKTEGVMMASESNIYTYFNNDLYKNTKKDLSSAHIIFLDPKPLNQMSFFDIENVKTVEKHGKKYVSVAPSHELIEGQLNTIAGMLQLQDLLNKYNPEVQLEYFKYKGKTKISLLEAEKWYLKTDFIKTRKTEDFFNRETYLGDINDIKNDFIFLKEGESYTEKINLLGLKLLGQNFRFDYRELKFKDYEERFNLSQKKTERFYYPQNINGYIPVNSDFLIEFTPLNIKL